MSSVVTDDNCLFCKIIKGEIPSTKVGEGEDWFAFEDINAQAPTHILVIPKSHYANVTEVDDKEKLGSLFQAASQLAKEKKLDKGFRLVVNTGEDGGQTVFHLHVHLMGGRALSWPPG